MHYEYPEEYLDAVRQVLADPFQEVSDEEIEEYLDSLTAEMSPEEAESFLRGVGNAFKKAGRVVVKALPTVAPIAGAAIGSVIAPGLGTAIGGALGNAAGSLARSAGKRVPLKQAMRQAVTSGVQGAAGSMAGGQRGGVGGALGNVLSTVAGGRSQAGGRGLTSPAINQLMQLINNPNLHQAVLGQVMGTAGRNAVPVNAGGRQAQVPFGAFMNALAQLAQSAASEAAEAEAEANPGYLMDSEGYYAVDPANPELRASHLMEWLHQESLEDWAREEEEVPAHDDLTEWFRQAGMMR